jgi:hypothetical protein
MPEFACLHRFAVAQGRRALRLSLCAAALLLSAQAPAGEGAAKDAIPNLSSANFGWLLKIGGTDFLPPPSGIGPVANDPRYPHVGNNQATQPTERIADVSNPNLKPWAAAQMQKANEAILKDHKVGFVAQSRCWPAGVPAELLTSAEPVFFIQTPKEVWIIWQRGQQPRRVFLNAKHSEHPTPSWFGESVGHYENGDTLVVDTIGLSAPPYNFLDNYRTPHTVQEHVIERWTVSKDGKTLNVVATVDDPGTFNKPFSAAVRYRRVQGAMIETVCAENNTNYFGLNEFPMPQADKPDF